MSDRRRKRDNISPSLFPFLAVLLCTMGSLVLILMLVVSGAQAAAKQITDESAHRIEEAEAQIELASYSYEKQLAERRIELEKERLKLQHLEDHIQELLTELSELQQTHDHALEEESKDDATEAELQSEISELEKQLADATSQLESKIDKPDGDKPIFAVIPYAGTSGTHRRPIYIECTSTGVVIQPEGIKLGLADLKPPHGPGNPLDAALRTIRAEFPAANGAVTSTAYPLLIVRPSGIAAYALARGAMSGWDDQFGYELVADDMELAFPDSSPGLDKKIVKAIELARQRQAALVMAMPQRFRQRASQEDFNEGSWSDSEGGSRVNPGTADSVLSSYGNETGLEDGSGPVASGPDGSGPSGRGRGGFANDSGAGLGETTDSRGGSNSPRNGSGASPMLGFGGSQELLSGDISIEPSLQPSLNASDIEQAFDNTSQHSSAGKFAANDGNSSEGDFGQPGAAGQFDGNSSSRPTAAPHGGNFDNSQTGSAAGASSSSNAGSTTGTQSAGNPSGSSQSSQSASPSSSSGSSSNSGASSSDESGTPPQVGVNATFGKKEDSAPVAQTRGRNWAWSQGPPTQSPVLRSVRMQCWLDRWVILPDRVGQAAITIDFDGTPQQRVERLAKAVSDRVDSWGLAIDGGFWKPILVVDVAPDAEWRFNQLERMLSGSGLEVKRREVLGTSQP